MRGNCDKRLLATLARWCLLGWRSGCSAILWPLQPSSLSTLQGEGVGRAQRTAIFSGPSGIQLGQMGRQKRCRLKCICSREEAVFKHVSQAPRSSFKNRIFNPAVCFQLRSYGWVCNSWTFLSSVLIYINERKMQRKQKKQQTLGILTVCFKFFLPLCCLSEKFRFWI